MISFITTGRDDDYGKNFLNRLYTSITKNMQSIERYDVEYEYVIVEWAPMKDYLIYNEMFKSLFEIKNMVDVIVKSDIIPKENLQSNIFYEYFAKNAGIRLAKYDSLIIVNSDVIIPNETMEKIVDLDKIGFDKKRFYRVRNRVQSDDNLNLSERLDLHFPDNPDAAICGAYAGDLLIVDRETLINYGEGFDETNPSHRTISQASMDGEILWNLHHKGITLEFIGKEYWHINHGTVPKAGSYNMKGYINKPDWGFISYPKKIINEKLIEIG